MFSCILSVLLVTTSVDLNICKPDLQLHTTVMLLAILPLSLSFCNKAVLSLVNQLGTKPLSKHSLSCDLTPPCKLLTFFNQNPWNKSGPDGFQFGILPRIFFKRSLIISTYSCIVTLTSHCKSFNHFASLL